MKAVIQRVSHASVEVDKNIVGKIDKGLLILLGVSKEDGLQEIKYLVEKIINLRIFTDENDKLNLSLLDIKGELLVVSQFTLYGDTRKGRRPSFDMAAKPEDANTLYEIFVEECKKSGLKVETGKFQAHMNISLTNDGPVTIVIDTNTNLQSKI